MNLDDAYDCARWAARNNAHQPGTPRMVNVAQTLADEVDRLRGELLKANADTERLEAEGAEAADEYLAELGRVADDYHAQLEAVHDLTETLAEERVQHAAQMERIRCELAATAARIAAWDDALGAVVPELEREMDAPTARAESAYSPGDFLINDEPTPSLDNWTHDRKPERPRLVRHVHDRYCCALDCPEFDERPRLVGP